MKTRYLFALAAAATLAAALTLSAILPAHKAQAQGSPGVELTTLTDATQVAPGAPCTVSCFFQLSTLKNYITAAATGQSIAANLVHTGAWKPLAITDGTEATCVATTTYIAQIYIPARMTVTGFSLVNATAVAGNLTVGLADSTGAPIAAAVSATTAASGTAAYQRIPFAVAYVANPGTYYVQLQCNNTGMKFLTHTIGDFRTTSQTSGTYGTRVAFTPPTTFTTAVGPVGSLY